MQVVRSKSLPTPGEDTKNNSRFNKMSTSPDPTLFANIQKLGEKKVLAKINSDNEREFVS